MTIQDTLIAVRQLGLTASWSSAYKEFRINTRGGNEDSAYYTNDAMDALHTANWMAAHEMGQVAIRRETGVEFKERQ